MFDVSKPTKALNFNKNFSFSENFPLGLYKSYLFAPPLHNSSKSSILP